MIALAHRGGANHPDLAGLENTMAAFQHAYDLGFRHLETDVHVSSDGVLMAFHDDVLDRVTNAQGAIDGRTAAQLRDVTIDGHPIPQMAELLDAFPEANWNVDLKSDRAVQPMVDLINERGMHDRFMIATFSPTRLRRFRRLSHGQVQTAAHTFEVLAFRFLPATLAGRLSQAAALQIPVTHKGMTVLTDRLIARAHAAGCQVHIWTIDDADEMNALINRGIDGIFTDRTDTLRTVLTDRGLWQEGSPHDGSAA